MAQRLIRSVYGMFWRRISAFGFPGVLERNFASGSHVPTDSKPFIVEQIDALYSFEPPIPEYVARMDEPEDVMRSRLLYQSRKRGMLENGLLLSCFAAKFLHSLNRDQLTTYDTLINLPSNDWDIYYWISGVKPVPEEFQSDVMVMMQKFVQNERKESRFQQPEL